jgi:hypothetical protein
VHFEWLFKGNPRRALGVELHFEKKEREENLKILNELKKTKEELEQALGEKIVIQEKWGRYSSRLYIDKNEGRMTEELKTWAINKMIIMYNLLQPKLEKLQL